jgi:hypothetical protein
MLLNQKRGNRRVVALSKKNSFYDISKNYKNISLYDKEGSYFVPVKKKEPSKYLKLGR